MDEDIRLILGGGGPEFQGSFFFESAKQNSVWRVGEPFFLEALAQERVFFRRRGADPRIFPLEVAEGFGLFGRRGAGGKKDEKDREQHFHWRVLARQDHNTRAGQSYCLAMESENDKQGKARRAMIMVQPERQEEYGRHGTEGTGVFG